jgi:hypothetical protein
MEELRRRLLAQAFLYNDPAAFVAGVDAVLQELAGYPLMSDKEPTAS